MSGNAKRFLDVKIDHRGLLLYLPPEEQIIDPVLVADGFTVEVKVVKT